MAERIHYLEERRHVVTARTRSSLSDGRSSVASRGTLAALRGGGAVWLLALKLALGLGAGGGLLALPVALGLLAHGVALGLRGHALGVALGRGADGLALGAALHLAHVLGAADGADWALAVDGALGAGGLLTTDFTFGAFANGVANSRARRVIALPFALGVALFENRNTYTVSRIVSKNAAGTSTFFAKRM